MIIFRNRHATELIFQYNTISTKIFSYKAGFIGAQQVFLGGIYHFFRRIGNVDFQIVGNAMRYTHEAPKGKSVMALLEIS